MNCIEAKEQIEFYVLGELSQSQQRRLKSHLADCPDCRKAEAEYRLIIGKIRRSSKANLRPTDLERNILASVEREVGTIARRSIVSPMRTLAASIAACLLIGLAAWQIWFPHSNDPAKSSSAIQPNPARSFSAAQPNMNLRSISTGARSSPASMADDIVIRGENIYLLFDNGSKANVAAFDYGTGTQKWASETESHGFITADDTQLYCLAPSEQGRLDLVAINTADGKTLWRHTEQGPDLMQSPCTPTILPGNRICWVVNTTIHVLDTSNGEVLWTYSMSDKGRLSEAVVVDGSLYVADTDELCCFDIESGRQSWRSQYSSNVSRWVSPLLAVADGQICVAFRLRSGKSKLLCMELANRNVLWTRTIPHTSRLCIAGNTLYLRSQDVQAVDRTSGDLLWSFPSRGCSPVTYANGRVYFLDSNDQGHLVALDGQTGRELWTLTEMRSCDAFVRIGDMGYLKTYDGIVHVIAFSG